MFLVIPLSTAMTLVTQTPLVAASSVALVSLLTDSLYCQNLGRWRTCYTYQVSTSLSSDQAGPGSHVSSFVRSPWFQVLVRASALPCLPWCFWKGQFLTLQMCISWSFLVIRFGSIRTESGVPSLLPCADTSVLTEFCWQKWYWPAFYTVNTIFPLLVVNI